MPRTVPVLAAAVALAVLAARRGRTWASTTAARRRERLPRGVQEYPARVVDRRGPAADALLPPRAETPAEIMREAHTERSEG